MVKIQYVIVVLYVMYVRTHMSLGFRENFDQLIKNISHGVVRKLSVSVLCTRFMIHKKVDT